MLILNAIIECAMPMHCGAGVDAILDQPVCRDAFGLWRIPGSSLAGAMRALGMKADAALTARMFGDQQADKSEPSLIWCEDGLLLDFDGEPALAKILSGAKPAIRCDSYVRDHVRIDLERGAGVRGGKFDMEFVPAGARFLLQFRCDGWDRPLTDAEEAYFSDVCGRFLAGHLEIGGKTGLGYGTYTVIDAELARLDLRRSADMAIWLGRDAFALPDPAASLPLPAAPAQKGARLNGWLDIPLKCAGPILIGGGTPRPGSGEPDMAFALTPRLKYKAGQREQGGVVWQAALPSSSIKGVLRHAVYAILRSLAADTARANRILDAMFGSISDDEGQCGKLVTFDALLAEAPGDEQFRLIQHVALDRFSGAALEGALFSEEPFWKSDASISLRIRAKDMAAHEAALLFHALFDLFDGALAFGSGANRGNGRLRLARWPEDPELALAALGGEMSWNGENILAGGALRECAAVWDAALHAEVGA